MRVCGHLKDSMAYRCLVTQEDTPLYDKLKALAATGALTLSPVTAAALSGAFLPGLLPSTWAGQAKIRCACFPHLFSSLWSLITAHDLARDFAYGVSRDGTISDLCAVAWRSLTARTYTWTGQSGRSRLHFWAASCTQAVGAGAAGSLALMGSPAWPSCSKSGLCLRRCQVWTGCTSGRSSPARAATSVHPVAHPR